MKPSEIAAAPFNSHRPRRIGREGFSIAAVRPCATADAMMLVQSVLVELAALHDRAEMFALLLEQAEILQWIAVDHDEVGAGPSLQRADLALLAHDLRADGCRLPDDLDRREHFGAEQELAALFHLQRAEQIGAVADFHARAFADFQ